MRVHWGDVLLLFWVLSNTSPKFQEAEEFVNHVRTTCSVNIELAATTACSLPTLALSKAGCSAWHMVDNFALDHST